ncbi:MAG: large conductance mechanosensitive channel [Cyclobacteriaceae bacterium]|jgi:large conductance mechanosensitive channel
MLKDFKAFAMKGNILDLAVAVIIGAAFKSIVTSFVNDILMPPIGILISGEGFKNLSYVLKAATETTKAVSINYGSFIQTVIDFIIIAFSVFIIVRVYTNTQKKAEEAPTPPPVPSNEEVLLGEIRDLLKRE